MTYFEEPYYKESPVIDRISRPPKRSEYEDFKKRLLEHAKTAYRYDNPQDYIWAAEQKLGVRLNSHEISFLLKNAKSPKGRPYKWDFTLGHPRGRYVYERPINNIYSKRLEDSDPEFSRNVFNERQPSEHKRAPRMDMRENKKIDPLRHLRDPDLAHDEWYEHDKDLYRDTRANTDSNSNFLELERVNDYLSLNLGGKQMSKILKSSVGEVKDLVELIGDSPTIRVTLSRMVKAGYSPAVAREIIADAEEVGAVRISNRRVIAEIDAEDIPEKLVPVTKYENQWLGEALEEGEMSGDDEEHPYDEEVGEELEEGEMSPDLETRTARRISAKITKIADLLENIETRLEDVSAPQSHDDYTDITSIEKDLDSLGVSVARLQDELDALDSVARVSKADYTPEFENDEDDAFPADTYPRTLLSDPARSPEEKNRGARRRSKKTRKASEYKEEVMGIEMGDEETYNKLRKEIERNDAKVVQQIKEARRRRAARRRSTRV